MSDRITLRPSKSVGDRPESKHPGVSTDPTNTCHPSFRDNTIAYTLQYLRYYDKCKDLFHAGWSTGFPKQRFVSWVVASSSSSFQSLVVSHSFSNSISRGMSGWSLFWSLVFSCNGRKEASTGSWEVGVCETGWTQRRSRSRLCRSRSSSIRLITSLRESRVEDGVG